MVSATRSPGAQPSGDLNLATEIKLLYRKRKSLTVVSDCGEGWPVAKSGTRCSTGDLYKKLSDDCVTARAPWALTPEQAFLVTSRVPVKQ